MLKRLTILSLIVIAGCRNAAPPKNVSETDSQPRDTVAAVKPPVNYWPVRSYPLKKGETEASKYLKYAMDGNFTDKTGNNRYMYAEILFDKKNAGIFLHKLEKSSPSAKFTDPVQIKMTDSSGRELKLTSTRSWNSSGGILIERRNNDYSQFRIFLLQSTGTVKVDIKDTGGNTYLFNIYISGLSDSFSRL